MASTGTRTVVLGGTSGIGLAVAELLVAQGHRVVVASSTAARVEAATATLGAAAEGHVVDLTDEGAVAALLAQVGALDHLVYTAGDALATSPIDALDLDAARRQLEVRLFGALAAVKHAAPRLRPGGSITLTGGSAADRPSATWAMAASTCGAIVSLTRTLAVELAPIRVNAVAPGATRTPLWSGIPEADREALFAGIGAGLPVGRVGEAEQIARAYAYLIDQPYATGTVLHVDGGALLV